MSSSIRRQPLALGAFGFATVVSGFAEIFTVLDAAPGLVVSIHRLWLAAALLSIISMNPLAAAVVAMMILGRTLRFIQVGSVLVELVAIAAVAAPHRELALPFVR